MQCILDNLIEHFKCATWEHFWFIGLVNFEFSSWEHCNDTIWKTVRKTSNNLPWDTAGTFFGNILSVPKVFLMGTSWLHHQEHLKCTENFLLLENCKEISLENLECSCSVQSWYIADILSMYLQCICSVPALDTSPHPQCELRDLPIWESTNWLTEVSLALDELLLGNLQQALKRWMSSRIEDQAEGHDSWLVPEEWYG